MGKKQPLLSFQTETFECTIHKPSRFMRNELRLAVPELDDHFSDLLVVVCFQKTHSSMYTLGSSILMEKEHLLDKFYHWGSMLSSRLPKFWTEMIDPSSGGPMISKGGSSVYSDIEGIQMLLGYRCITVGGCSVVEHPRFGSHCYPSTLFTTAPLNMLEEIIPEVNLIKQM